jgi:RND family efflux transporter MFP subunit
MGTLKNLLSRLRRGPILVLAGAVVLFVVLVSSRPQRPPLELPEKAWSVSVVPARATEIQPNLELYAKVESPQDANLSAAVEADVLEVLVQDGDTVAAGDVLMLLDDQDSQLDLLQREADVQEIRADINLERQRLLRNDQALGQEQDLLALTESNSERVRSLYDDKLLSQSDVDDSTEELKRQQLAVTSRQLLIEESQIRVKKLQAQLTRAKALRDRAKLTADRTRITAPFDGAISNVQVSVGDRVRIGDELLRIHNPQAIELRSQVPTRFAARVRDALAQGADMKATVDVAGSEYGARLQRLSSQTRQGSGSVDAYLSFDSLPPETQLGATLRVLLSLPAEPGAIAVPAEAVYGRGRIYIADGDRMLGLDVERLGERRLPDGSSEVIIRSPELERDDQIIATKVSTAADGLLVAIRDPAIGNAEGPVLAVGVDQPEPEAK